MFIMTLNLANLYSVNCPSLVYITMVSPSKSVRSLNKFLKAVIHISFLILNFHFQILLKYLLIDNDDLQLAAGGCLYNIRNLAFNAEVRKWIFFNEPVDSETEKGIKKYRENVIDEEPKKELEVIEIPVNTVKKFKKEKLLKVRFGDRGDEFSLDDSVTLPEKTEKEE